MSSAPRISVQYILLFGATGVSLPFASVWLRAQGLSGVQIGAVLAAPMLGRLLTGPLLALWADGFRTRRTPMALLGAAAAAGYGAAAVAEGFWPRLLCWFVAATSMAALIPLTDVLNLRMARADGHTFSGPRGFGSAAFVLANVIMGVVLTRSSPDWVIVWVITAGALITLWSWRGLPSEPVDHRGPRTALHRLRDMRRLLEDARFCILLLAVGCVQAAHAFYYGFSALLWRQQGAPESLTGLFWAFSVLVEIGFMWWAEPWRRAKAISASTLLLIGCAAAVARWSLMSMSPPLWSVWGLQSLHALSFAATFLASVELIERLVPPEAQTSAQTLNSAVSSGVLIGAATLASGQLYDRVGVLGYLAMAVLAALGGMLALRLASLRV